MLVKICGLRTKSAALAAARAGADFLGFNFVPSSKRKVTIAQARSVIATLPKKNRPQLVGVFQNQSLKEIRNILRQVPLDLVQLHGDESPSFALAVKKPIIKAFGVHANASAAKLAKQLSKYKAKYFMLDRKDRGTGPLVNFSLVEKLSSKFPIILAGGLNLKNLKKAILRAGRIVGMDVAGGVESGNHQNINKIKAFVSFIKVYPHSFDNNKKV